MNPCSVAKGDEIDSKVTYEAELELSLLAQRSHCVWNWYRECVQAGRTHAMKEESTQVNKGSQIPENLGQRGATYNLPIHEI